MGIRVFFFCLTMMGLFVMFYEIDASAEIKESKEQIPLVEFTNATMFELDQAGVKQVLQSERAFIFKTKERFQKAHVVQQNKEKQEYTIINSDEVLKVKEKFELTGNVQIKNWDDSTLEATKILYDNKTHIMNSIGKFTFQKDSSVIVGDDLYYEYETNHMVSKNNKMKILLKDNNETN
ncbi:MAG: LPS export ABC transporter periplasmic protein LptC [Campylobacterales bacterium]|nr:LPS export ABC transporter periplasmic protein LptC [Campylobacterales bacterium]